MVTLVLIYLYGNPSFKVSENRLILLATIEFITDSNRFVKEEVDNIAGLSSFLFVCLFCFEDNLLLTESNLFFFLF